MGVNFRLGSTMSLCKEVMVIYKPIEFFYIKFDDVQPKNYQVAIPRLYNEVIIPENVKVVLKL